MSEECNGCKPSPLEQVCSLYTELALEPEKDFGWGYMRIVRGGGRRR